MSNNYDPLAKYQERRKKYAYYDPLEVRRLRNIVNEDYVKSFSNDATAYLEKHKDNPYSAEAYSEWQSGLAERYKNISSYYSNMRYKMSDEDYAKLSEGFARFDDISGMYGSYSSADEFVAAMKYSEDKKAWEGVKELEDFKEYSDLGMEAAYRYDGSHYENEVARHSNSFVDRPYVKDENGNWVPAEHYNRTTYFNPLSLLPTGEKDSYSFIKELSDNEVGIYNYYFAKEGKAKADEYLDFLKGEVNTRSAFKIADSVDGGLSEVFYSAAAGMYSFAEGTANAVAGVFGEAPLYSPITQAHEMTASNNEGFSKVVNDLSYTVGNMLPSILIGRYFGPLAGRVSMGASAGGNAYAEMRRLGYDEDVSRGYGVLIGASETVLEGLIGGISSLGGKYSVKTLIASFAGKVDNALARIAINWGTSMLSEGLEEGIQTALEPIFKAFVTGESFEGADIDEVMYSAMLGALSAGLLEGAPTIVGEVNTYKQGKALQNAGDEAVSRLKELGMSMPDGSDAKRLAGNINEKTGAYTYGRLLNEVGYSLSKKNIADIEKSLTRKGISAKDAKTISKWLNKAVEGENFTASQRRALENNKDISDTFRDVIFNSNSTIYQRINEYNELGEIASGKSAKAANAHKASKSADKSENESVDTDIARSQSGDITLNGRQIELLEVASVKDGVTRVRIKGGTTVNADDVDFGNSSLGILYKSAIDMGLNAAAANALIRGYDAADGLSVDDYARGFKEAYTYGKYGYPAEQMTKDGFSALMSEESRRLAYQLGESDARYSVQQKQDRIKEKTVARKSGDGSMSIKEALKIKSLNDKQKSGIEAAKVISEALGIKIRFFVSKVRNGRRVGENGRYDPKTGTVYIDVYAGMDGEGVILFTLAHELTHHIREWSPVKFKAFADFLFSEYGKAGKSVEALVKEQIAKAKRNGREISYDVAYEEVVADSCMTMLNDSKAIEKIAKLKAQDKGLWSKIKNFITGLVNKIKAAYKGVQPYSREGIMLSEALGNLEQLQEMWTDALIDAGDAYSEAVSRSESAESTEAEGEVLYDARETLEEASRKLSSITDVDYLKDKEANPFILVMDHTPKIVLEAMEGSNDRKILIRRDALYLAIRDNGIQKGHYHGLGDKVLSELPKYLEEPDVILSTIDPTTEEESKSRRLVLTHIPVKNGQAIISIEFDTIKDFEGKNDYFNLVVTVFDLHENYLKRQFNKFGAKVKYQKEDLTQVNPQLFEWLRTINAKSSSKGSIQQNGENVNTSDEELHSERDYPIDTDVEKTVNAALGASKSSMHVLSEITPEQNKAINRLVNQTNNDLYRGKFTGGKHRFSDTAIKHIISEHGDFLREGLRAQLPMTPTDIARHLSAIKDNKAPSTMKPTKTAQGNPSILTSYEVNGYTLYAEEITKPLGKNSPSDLVGHTMYKAPTLSTAAFYATSAQTQPKRQSQVLYKYYTPNGSNLSIANFVTDEKGEAAKLYFVSLNGAAKQDPRSAGLIALSSDISNFTDKQGNIEQGYVHCKKPFYITADNRVFSNSDTDVAAKINELKKQGYDCFIFDKVTGDNYMVAVVNKAQIVKNIDSKVEPEAENGELHSDRDNAGKITADMSDTERAEILRKKKIVAPVYKGEADASIEREGGLEKQSKSFIKDALERIGKEFEVFTEYDIKDVDLKIILSANNLRESIHKEATPAQIAKLLPILRDTLENAKGIERHNNRYYYDNYTVDFENLLGAYIDGEYIVPVRFGLKHGKMGETTLYVLIDQEKIKAEVIKKARSIKLKATSSRSAYVYSIAQIVPFVNSKDLLRYLPDDMLNASQREIKWQGIAETIEYTDNKNDEKYFKFLKNGNLRAAKDLVRNAATMNGYDLVTSESESYYISKDGKSKKSAETITYDDNDNVIPISKRFDSQNEDEKYSVRDSYDEYSKQNANQIISSITYNALKFNDGSVGKIEGKAEIADIIWRKLNTTDYQDREYAASELAEEVIKRVTVKADNPDKAMYADTVKAIKPYLHSFNLDAIRAEIEHRYGKNEAKGIILAWGAKKGERGISADSVAQELTSEGIRIEATSEADIFFEIYELYKRASEAVKAKTSVTLDTVIPKDERAQLKKAIEREILDGFRILGRNAANIDPELNAAPRERAEDYLDLSNRGLLVNALEGAVQNDIEYKKLTEYKSKLGEINKLQERKNEITSLLFDKSAGITGQQRKELQFELRQISNRLEIFDKQLLNLEATKALKAVLEREKTKAYKKAEQRGREAIKAERAWWIERQKDLRNENKEARARKIEGRRKTEMRHKIKLVVNNLNHLLLFGTKERNIKAGLQEAVAMALDAINFDTVGAEKRIAKLNEELKKAKTPEKIQEIVRKIDNIQNMGDRMTSRLKALKEAYEEIASKGDSEYAPYFKNEANLIIELTKSTMEVVGDTPLREMSLRQLTKVHDLYSMILRTIQLSNKVWRDGKALELDKEAEAIKGELRTNKALSEERTRIGEGIRDFKTKEYTPYYAFASTSSAELTKYFFDLIEGQNVYARDIEEAKAFASETRKKYGYSKWDFNKIYKFTLKDEREFELTLKHLLSIYAYSRRSQSLEHMRVGGFFYDPNETFRKKLGVFNTVKDNEVGYRVDLDILLEMTKAMTEEQIRYVEEMQQYLTEMGSKGNEVTQVMWGIDVFKESVYFPLVSVEDFIARSTETAGVVSLKNSGMTKETKIGANNPIVLEGFDDVWASHVEKMCRYHGFVLPIDNLNKVLHYGKWSDANAETVSTVINGRFGKSLNDYFEQFITDLNGGVHAPSFTHPLAKFIGKMKKTAVGLSLSTIVQQPTAILRAASELNPKYFVSMPKFSPTQKRNAYAEMKKYAPIAIIKEIGGFDAGSGGSVIGWLNEDTLHGVNKAMKVADDVSMWGASKADEIGWLTIWAAVKKEVKDTTDLQYGSEEFLKKAGERFTEIIVKTQVYDSTLSRNEYMRSKNEYIKMLSAFMGEPTLSLNMMMNAVTQVMHGKISKKHAVRIIGSVYASTITAAMMASLIYALNDDDEDESYTEKYMQALGGKLASELNPLNMLIGFRDIVSIFDGWEVERTDVAIFQDLYNAFNGLFSERKSPWRKVEDFAGAIGAMFGLPVKNLIRTARQIINAIKALFDDNTGGELFEEFWSSFLDGSITYGIVDKFLSD